MGARWLSRAVLSLALLLSGARAAASTVVEPIARLFLEGGYDSNPFYDGTGSDTVGRIAPEVGILARDHLWNLRLTYGGDYVVHEQTGGEGGWNQHAGLALDMRPTRRLMLRASARFDYAFDPLGLAAMGIFREAHAAAIFANGRGRGEYRLTHLFDATAEVNERVVRFDDTTGGAMHAGSLGLLARLGHAVRAGASYGLSVFQSFETDRNEIAFAHALKARAELRASRTLQVNVSAGPALWLGPDGSTIVPEASVELLHTTRDNDVRIGVQHGLGIGSTARPSLVDSAEMGAAWRIGHRVVLRGDAGLWRSGIAPSGDGSTLGYAAGGEAALVFRSGTRLGLYVNRYARIENPDPALERTIIGLRFGWALETR